MMGFDSGPLVSTALNGIRYQLSVTIAQNTWYYFAATIMKINYFQSKQCIQFYTTFNCQIFNQIFTDWGKTAQLRIGEGFLGVIRKVKIFEYPKIQLELSHNFRLACKFKIDFNNNILANKACLPFNGNMCLECDIEAKSNDTNFKYKCYSTCNEH